jgi:hypothetical protein
MKRNFFLIVILTVSLAAFGLTGCDTGLPSPLPTQNRPATGGSDGLDAAMLNEVDQQIAAAQSANIAFNDAPEEMNLEDTAIITLVLSPTLTEDELKQLITAPGVITTDSIMVTPFMRADLLSTEPGAFTIVGLPQTPEQVVTTLEPTQWVWSITPLEEGKHTLHLTISRLVVFQGEQTWRPVKTYTKTMQVNVTFQQRLARIDWKWIVGLMFTAILPIIWRYQDKKKKT